MATTTTTKALKTKVLPLKNGKRDKLIYIGGMRVEGTKIKRRFDFSTIQSASERVKASMLNMGVKDILKKVDNLNDAKLRFRNMLVSEFKLNKDKLERTRVIKEKVKEIKSMDTIYKRELMEVLNTYSFLIKNSIVITGDSLDNYGHWLDIAKMTKKAVKAIEYGADNGLKLKATKSGVKKAAKAGLTATYDYMDKIKQDFVKVAEHKQAVKLEQLKEVFNNENKMELSA